LSNAKSGIDGEVDPGFRFTQSGLCLLREIITFDELYERAEFIVHQQA